MLSIHLLKLANLLLSNLLSSISESRITIPGKCFLSAPPHVLPRACPLCLLGRSAVQQAQPTCDVDHSGRLAHVFFCRGAAGGGPANELVVETMLCFWKRPMPPYLPATRRDVDTGSPTFQNAMVKVPVAKSRGGG